MGFSSAVSVRDSPVRLRLPRCSAPLQSSRTAGTEMEGGTARYDATPPSDASFLKGWRGGWVLGSWPGLDRVWVFAAPGPDRPAVAPLRFLLGAVAVWPRSAQRAAAAEAATRQLNGEREGGREGVCGTDAAEKGGGGSMRRGSRECACVTSLSAPPPPPVEICLSRRARTSLPSGGLWGPAAVPSSTGAFWSVRGHSHAEGTINSAHQPCARHLVVTRVNSTYRLSSRGRQSRPAPVT